MQAFAETLQRALECKGGQSALDALMPSLRCVQVSGADIKDNPGSKRELNLIQETFNQGHEESGLA